MPRPRPYLIAEIGVNHDGSVARASDMIRRAAECGFDAVKFQHWIVDELLAKGAPRADYQGAGGQEDLLAGLSLSVDELRELQTVTRDAGIGFIVTADGERALSEVMGVGVDLLKIGSGDADNPWLLDAAAATGAPLVVSLGMTSDDDVRTTLARVSGVADLTLLHCVSAYPTPLREANLGRIPALRDLAGRPVGFSDHTIGITAAAAALALGAIMIEKHVTWSFSAPGPDHAMSLELADAHAWVTQLRDLECAMTTGLESEDELRNRAVVRKALYLRRAIAAGSRLEPDDLLGLRPLDDGIPVADRDAVVGAIAVRDLEAGTRLRRDDIRPG